MKSNNIIKLLMLSDIFVLTGFGLVAPILAIYIKENLEGGSIFAAGLASTMFLITKSIIQLPVSVVIDRYDDRSDIKWLLMGTFITFLVPFVYIFASNVYHIYLAEILFGFGAGLSYPAWLGLWSTHLDKHKESYEWSVYSTLSSIGTAIAAAVGAAIAEFAGFTYAFLFVALMILIGSFFLIKLKMEEIEHKSIRDLIIKELQRPDSHRVS